MKCITGDETVGLLICEMDLTSSESTNEFRDEWNSTIKQNSS